MGQNNGRHQKDEEAGMDDISDRLSTLNADIIRTHILTRVDGKTLISIAATCSRLRDIVQEGEVWAKLCHSTWPSTKSPILRHVMRSFPHTVFRDVVSLRRPIHTTCLRNAQKYVERMPRLISAVDLYYMGKPVLSAVGVTETMGEGLLREILKLEISVEKEEEVGTGLTRPLSGEYEELCDLERGLGLSWIVIDESGRRAVNVCKMMCPIITGYYQHDFIMLFKGRIEGRRKWYKVWVTLTFDGEEGEELKFKDGWLEMESVGGRRVEGREGLVILGRTLGAPRETELERSKRLHGVLNKLSRRDGWFHRCFPMLCPLRV